MKSWQFWLLFLLVAATLFVVVKTGLGLQSAQNSVSSIFSPIKNLLATKV
jgi:hypothetical protein